jgi:hypothetical protein
MSTSRRRVFRLAVVAIAMAGTTLTSSAVLAADGSESVEELAIPDAVPDDPKPQDPSVIELIVESAPAPSDATDQSGETAEAQPADDPTTDEPTADGLVTNDPVTNDPVTNDPVTNDPATNDPATNDPATNDPVTDEHVLVEPMRIEPVIALTDSAPVVEAQAMAMEEPPDPDEHGGHEGGPGGMGNPYRMTFTVSWRLTDGTPIPELDKVLPENWRTLFDLTADSATGSGKPTTAHCTYPAGSNDLVCEFANGNHQDITDGMVVPGKPPAAYDVNVRWTASGWTITGANAGPYSARKLCPRGGGGEEGGGGHEGGGGEEGGGGHEGGGGEEAAEATIEEEPESSAFYCEHEVILQQVPVASEPPATTAPTSVPAPAVETPVAGTPVAQPPATETAAVQTPAPQVLATAPRTIPTTGNTVTTSLLFGLLLGGLGLSLLLATRRRPHPTR